MTQHRPWQLKARATGSHKLEIVIHDVIGKSLFEDGYTSKNLLAALRSMPNAREIDLRINSLGGLVHEAKGIVNLLRAQQARGVRVTAYVDGIAASAASYLLTVADRVVMPSNAFQMVHATHAALRGGADDLEQAAAHMRRENEHLAEAYAMASQRRRKGKTKGDFLALFAKGDTYLDADQSIAWGLADEKVSALKVAASLVDLTGFDTAPHGLRSAPYALRALSGGDSSDFTRGRAFASMGPMERHRVKQENEAYYNQLRGSYFAAQGQLTNQLRGAKTHAEYQQIRAKLTELGSL